MKRRGLFALAIALLFPCSTWAADQLISGKLGLLKPTKLVKGLFKGTFALPDSASTPSLHVFDTGGGAGDQTFDLSAATVTPLGPDGSKGVKFKSGSCPVVLIKANVIKYVCKAGVTLATPVQGDLGVVLSVGTTRYCALFPSATATKNTATLFKAKDAVAPGACPASGGGTTTTTTSSSTTTSSTPDYSCSPVLAPCGSCGSGICFNPDPNAPSGLCVDSAAEPGPDCGIDPPVPCPPGQVCVVTQYSPAMFVCATPCP